MKIDRLEIPDVVVLTPRRFADDRGYFSETWSQASLDDVGIAARFVQDNHAASVHAGTVRGLHYQLPPTAQDKLLRVVRGSIIDVAVDIRRSSPTFGQHVSAVLSAENWAQLWVPKGFAHGYCTLEPDTEVLYKVTAPYSRADEAGILWNDPALAIDWKLPASGAVLSDKDKLQPLLADSDRLFD